MSEPRLHEHGFLDILVRDSAKIELGKKLVQMTQIILFMEHPLGLFFSHTLEST